MKIQKASSTTVKENFLSRIAPEMEFLKTKSKSNPMVGNVTMQIEFPTLQSLFC